MCGSSGQIGLTVSSIDTENDVGLRDSGTLTQDRREIVCDDSIAHLSVRPSFPRVMEEELTQLEAKPSKQLTNRRFRLPGVLKKSAYVSASSSRRMLDKRT